MGKTLNQKLIEIKKRLQFLKDHPTPMFGEDLAVLDKEIEDLRAKGAEDEEETK